MRLTARFTDALSFAAALHAAQTRKGGAVPYLAHLLAVAGIVLEHGGDEDEAIAALLHDAVEDQGGQATAAVIRERFGERVVQIVLGCTDADCIPKPPWRARKEQYVAHLATASASEQLISAADKLHNARSVLEDYRQLGEALWPRFTGQREGTLWYYRAVADALAVSPHRALVEELDRTVKQLEVLAEKAGGIR